MNYQNHEILGVERIWNLPDILLFFNTLYMTSGFFCLMDIRPGNISGQSLQHNPMVISTRTWKVLVSFLAGLVVELVGEAGEPEKNRGLNPYLKIYRLNY